MKKALVLTLIMVLAVAGIASAEVKLGGELKVEYVVNTDNQKDDKAGTGEPKVPLKLTVKAEEEGVWDLKADLDVDVHDDNAVGVGDWTMNFVDKYFAVELWGGDVEKDYLHTPLEFVETDDPAEADVARMRLTSDVLGMVNLTLDYQPDELFVFATKAMDDVTVGAAIKKDLVAEGLIGAGYVEYVFGRATLTGEVGINNTEHDEDNLLLGGKVSYALNDQITLRGKVAHKAELVGDELVLEAGADYVEDLFKVSGTYTWKDEVRSNEDDKATNKLKAGVTFRSNEDVAFGDLFDDYATLTGYAAFAEIAYTTAADTTDDKEPLMEVTLKGAATAVPDMVWVKGEFVYKSDKDKTAEDEDFDFITGNDSLDEDVVLNAKDYYRLTAESTIKLTERVKLKPAVKYGSWTNVKVTETGTGDDLEAFVGLEAEEMTDLELVAAMTYALSDSSEIGLSYTDRTQKLTNPTIDGDERKDGFAKVYFKTSF